MGIVARINDALGIRSHEFYGAIEVAELVALAEFYQANSGLVRTDIISVVHEHATGHSGLMEHLALIRERFSALHRSSDFLLVRRSAWVCPNPSAWALLEDFLHERHSRDGLGSEVCLVATIAEADSLFEPDELATVNSGDGFRTIFSIDYAYPGLAKVG